MRSMAFDISSTPSFKRHGYMNEVAQRIIRALPLIGVSEITEENLELLFIRLHMLDSANQEKPLELNDIRQFVGLRVYCNNLTDEEFKDRVAELLTDRAKFAYRQQSSR